MKRKSAREKVKKGSLSMHPKFWDFADSRVVTESHNSIAAYIVDRIRRHMDEVTNFSRQVGTSAAILGLPSAANAPVGTTQVLNLVLTEGDFEGTLDAAWDRVRGASSYEIQISVDPITPTSWAFKQSASKSSATISGLTSGTKLWVHVRAIGAGNTPGPWSDPATKVVP